MASALPSRRESLLIALALLLGLLIGRHQQQTTPRSTGQPQHATPLSGSVLPAYDHAASEAAFQASQRAALEYLESHDVNTTVDIWFLMAPHYSCPSRQRIGRLLDGGKWVCAARQLLSRPDCVIYSVGSNGEVSFEKAILRDFPHCRIHTYDHTLSNKRKFKVWRVPGVTFHQQGVTSEQALSEDGRQFTTLPRMMEVNGDAWVSILKMDIEGGEWKVLLEALDAGEPLPFTQILLEIHTGALGADILQVLRRFFRGMHDAGFRVFHVEPNYIAAQVCLEFAFVQVDDRGYIVTGATEHD